MWVKVRYFAIVRERLACAEEEFELPEGSHLGDLVAAMKARHSALGAMLPHVRLAVDEEFQTLEAALQDGSEVALIPPVAGGAAPPTRRA